MKGGKMREKNITSPGEGKNDHKLLDKKTHKWSGGYNEDQK